MLLSTPPFKRRVQSCANAAPSVRRVDPNEVHIAHRRIALRQKPAQEADRCAWSAGDEARVAKVLKE
eukprot:scaffold3068_cov401-Prasinococcus_capsulatus_cf.AAC.59